MDLLSVMNQRASDQHSEVYHSRISFAAHCVCAAVALLLAVHMAPCGAVKVNEGVEPQSTSFSTTASTILFVVLEVAAYVLLVRGLHALASSRFISPIYGTAAPLSGGSHHGITWSNLAVPCSNGQQRTCVYGIYASTVLTVLLGSSSSMSYGLFMMAQLAECALFCFHAVSMCR